jgi:hypothetical protein
LIKWGQFSPNNIFNEPMSNREQEIVGSFMAVDDRHAIRRIVVSQDCFTNCMGETTHSKNLFLENINGPKVYRTEDPDILKLIDGTTLKRRGHLLIDVK